MKLLKKNDIARILSVSPKTVQGIVSRNLLVPQNERRRGTYLQFTVDAIRAHIYEHRPLQTIKCYKCKRKVIGDLFCAEHLPERFEPRPAPPQIKVLDADDPDLPKKIGTLYRQHRHSQGMTQKKAAETVGYVSTEQIVTFELGTLKTVDIQKAQEKFGALGCKITISIERLEN